MKKFAVGVVALLVTAAWSVTAKEADPDAGPKKAIAVVHGIGDHKVHGTVTFTKHDDSIEISIKLSGLTPGEHAFHIHEFGDCSSKDGMAAGGHFNPEKHKHGGPHAEQRHVGDLGNIKADDDGKVELTLDDKLIQLQGPHSIIGRSVIVHEKADDLKTDPAGNAGARIACGVVGIAK
ncbi:MAG TPA: superoxide dismutase family protein [Gemmataceae bacterium]|nr:superoxide dismutase family protein [Gemmataceae bacterium]